MVLLVLLVLVVSHEISRRAIVVGQISKLRPSSAVDLHRPARTRFTNYIPKKHVNIVKKVKVAGIWRFYPALLDSEGRLDDEVQVNGRVERHTEGSYFIEWYERGSRRRRSIPDRHSVLREAYSKAIDLDALSQESNKSAALPASRLDARRGCQTLVKHAAEVGKSSTAVFKRMQCTLPYLSAQRATPTAKSQRRLLAASRRLQPTARSNCGKAWVSAKIPISEAINAYLQDITPPQRSKKTYSEYRLVLRLFCTSCDKRYLQEVARNDCLKFMRHLYTSGNQARTVFNRIGIVVQFLKLQGITGLLTRQDKPNYVERIRRIYDPTDLHDLFKSCAPEDRIRYLFFLLTGERDQEVRYTTWADVDFNRCCVRVTAKPHWGFVPKNKQEREIPVPSSLVVALQEFKTSQFGPNPRELVFPSKRGRPDKSLQTKLKRVAYRAGLNCDRCISKCGNRCSDGPYCEHWCLHKFRHTFATSCLENGISIRSLQEWLGHKSLESTMLYLKYVHPKSLRKIIEHSELSKFIR